MLHSPTPARSRVHRWLGALRYGQWLILAGLFVLCLVVASVVADLQGLIRVGPGIELTDDVSIILERLCPFFNSCPTYRLTIRGNGTVVFEGGDGTLLGLGRVTTTIPKERVGELLDAFDRARFLYLGNYECGSLLSGGCPTDLPYAIVSLTANGLTKTVRHYSPDRTAPQALTDLECKIDKAVDSQQWVTVPIPGCD